MTPGKQGMSVPHHGMGIRHSTDFSTWIHTGQHSSVQRCMLDPKHTNVVVGMEHLSVWIPKLARFH